LEFEKKENCSKIKKFLSRIWKVKKDDIYKVNVITDLSFLHRFSAENLNRRLKFLLQYPTNPQAKFYNCKDVF
jgi:hypothetical protein